MLEIFPQKATPEGVVLSASLYAALFFYFAWVCRRKSLARMRWAMMLFAVATILAAIALYLMLFLPLPLEQSFRWGRWLSLSGMVFLAGAGAFVAWEFLAKKPAGPAPLKLLAPAERRRFWIETGAGFTLALVLFLI